MTSRPYAPIRWIALAVVAGLLAGCIQTVSESLLAQASRTLEHQHLQDLDNIAMFLVIPDGLPHYIRVHRGSVEAHREPKWSVGTDLYISGKGHLGIVWEVSAVTDPGDLQRLRLLFQWTTRRIDFDEFEGRWNAIRDQPDYNPDARQRFNAEGRPVLIAAPLPISRDTGRDWYTTDENQAVASLDPGAFRKKKVWIKDVAGAAAFTLAAQRAIPNTKPPPALPMPGR